MLGFSDSIIISPLERRRLKHRLRNPSHTVFYAERKETHQIQGAVFACCLCKLISESLVF